MKSGAQSGACPVRSIICIALVNSMARQGCHRFFPAPVRELTSGRGWDWWETERWKSHLAHQGSASPPNDPELSSLSAILQSCQSATLRLCCIHQILLESAGCCCWLLLLAAAAGCCCWLLAAPSSGWRGINAI